MKLNSKGQVTIPAATPQTRLDAGDEVEVVEDGNTLRIVHSQGVIGGMLAHRPRPARPRTS